MSKTGRPRGTYDKYTKGWEDGMQQARRIVLRSDGIEDAVARLERLMAEGRYYEQQAAAANVGRSA